MGIRTIASSQRQEEHTKPIKKLQKLKSVKIANLDRLRLSIQRSKSRLSRAMVVTDDQAALERPKTPNYMKATSCFNARKGTLKTTTDETVIEVISARGLKRISSLKRLKRTPSLRSRWSSTKRGARVSPLAVATDEISGGGASEDLSECLEYNGTNDDQGTAGQGDQAIKQMVRSRSIKLTKVRSVKLLRRRSTGFCSALLNSSRDEANESMPSVEDVEQYSETGITKPMKAPGLRALRTLSKMPSLRSRRRSKKTHSGHTGTRFNRATCSSMLKSCNIQPEEDLSSREDEPKGHSVSHVCPYSYCSLHGYHHDPVPPLKSFISAKRHSLKKQKGKRVRQVESTKPMHSHNLAETEHTTELVCLENHGRSRVTGNGIETSGEWEGISKNLSVQAYAKLKDTLDVRSIHDRDNEEVDTFFSNETKASSSLAKMISLTPEMVDQSPSTKVMREATKEKQETAPSSELSHSRLAGESEVEVGGHANNILLDQHSQPNAWSLIFSHFLLPGNEQSSEVEETGQNEEPITKDADVIVSSLSPQIEEPDLHMEEQDAGNENLELTQAEAIELVQEAVDELLRLDMEVGDHQKNTQDILLRNDTVSRKEGKPCESALPSINTTRENFREIDMTEDVSLCSDLKNSEQVSKNAGKPVKANSNEEKNPTSKGLTKLKKLIITAKSIRTMERLIKIKSREPCCLSSETSSGLEKTLLRHHSINSRRNAEELMLDYALRQVIAKLAPAQQRRVKMLIEAFQTVSPDLGEKGMKSFHRSLQPTEYTGTQLTTDREEEKCTASHYDFSVLAIKTIQEPDGRTSSSYVDDSLAPLASEDPINYKKAGIRMKAALNSDGTGQNSRLELFGKPGEETTSGDAYFAEDAQAVNSLMAEKMEAGNYNRTDEVPDDNYAWVIEGQEASKTRLKCNDDSCGLYKSSVEDSQNSGVLSNSNNLEKENGTETMDTGMLGEQTNTIEGTGNSLLIPHPTAKRDLQVDSSVGEGTNILFDKQKFTDVWNMVYKNFIASEPQVPENQKKSGLSEKEQDECVEEIRIISRSDSSPSQKVLNQADAIQLVQEAIDELLRLHGKLSDQQPISVPKILKNERESKEEDETCLIGPSGSTEVSFRDTDPTEKENNSLEPEGGQMVEPERADAKEKEQVQAQPSKAFGKLKSLMVSTKFIKAMQKLRKINARTGQSLSLAANSETEKVYLRHLSMDERRNSDEWMLNYALQQVLAKMDQAKQRRVAMLTQAFESVNPEVEVMKSKHRPLKMQHASTNIRENEKETITEVHESPTAEQKLLQPNDAVHSPERSSFAVAECVLLPEEDQVDAVSDSTKELHDDNLEFKRVNLHIHRLDGVKGCPVCCPPENAPKSGKEGIDLPQKQVICKLTPPTEGPEHDHLRKRNYSKIWNLIYQQVKSSAVEDTDSQMDEVVTSENQINHQASEANFRENMKNNDMHNVSLELNQSNVNKIVHEALEGILSRSYSDHMSPKEDDNGERLKNLHFVGSSSNSPSRQDVVRSEINDVSDSKKEEVPQNNKSEPKTFKKYSRWKRALIYSKFVKAMERMQKLQPQGKSYNAAKLDQGAEVVSLRRCSLEERSNSEEWMFDYALQMAIAKLAPAQQKRVSMLVEAFETITPNSKEAETKELFHVTSGANECVSLVVDEQRREKRERDGNQKVPEDRTLPENNEVTSSGSHNKGHMENGQIPSKTNSRSMVETSKTVPINCTDEPRSTDRTALLHTKYAQLKLSAVKQDVIGDLHPAYEPTPNSSQSELLGDDKSTNEMGDTFFNGQRYTSMWQLICRQLESSTAQNPDEQMPRETNSNKALHEKMEKAVDSYHSSSETNQAIEDDILDKDSTSPELHQEDAVKLVEEAVNEILLIEAPSTDDESTAASPGLAQEEDIASFDKEKEPKDGENRRLEELDRSYSVMSKYIICKKFIKAIEKMKKPHPRKQWSLPRQASSEAESVNLRQQSVNKKNYEELMLDNALQQVIGKLGPAQKKKVSLLVEAFEKINPSTDTGPRQRLNTVA